MLRISLIFYIFAPLKKENDMAEIANRIYETRSEERRVGKEC